MKIDISRTKDGHPAVKVRHLTFAMLPGRVSQFAIFSRYPARNPEECVAADFTSYDRQVDSEADFIAHVQEIADHYDEVSRLGRTKLDGVIPSIWGPSQTREEYYPGIETVTTASHGGFILSAEMNELVDPAWRSHDASYEEDCAWAVVAFTFPHLFTQRESKFATRVLKDYYPDAWEQQTGQTLKPGESDVRDRETFMDDNAENFVVIAAIQSNVYRGQVECTATKGGDRNNPKIQFLVPAGEYKIGRFGFVIDEARHLRVGASNLTLAVHMLGEKVNDHRFEIEKMTETALSAGDQAIAEKLAEQIVDIDEVLPRLTKLLALPGTLEPLPAESKNPCRQERGMKIVYLETIKMLEAARHERSNSATSNITLDERVALYEDLLTKVRSLYHCAIEDTSLAAA